MESEKNFWVLRRNFWNKSGNLIFMTKIEQNFRFQQKLLLSRLKFENFVQMLELTLVRLLNLAGRMEAPALPRQIYRNQTRRLVRRHQGSNRRLKRRSHRRQQ